MVESFRRHCKLAVEANPLEPVAQIYEEQIAVMKRDFAAANEELLEFEGLVEFTLPWESSYRCIQLLNIPNTQSNKIQQKTLKKIVSLLR